MGQTPGQDADVDVYAHLDVPPSAEERAEGRRWARGVLADKRASEDPARRDEMRRRFRADAA